MAFYLLNLKIDIVSEGVSKARVPVSQEERKISVNRLVPRNLGQT